MMEKGIPDELAQQPQVLRELAAYYCSGPGKVLLAQIPPGERLLFTADGSIFPLADWAAQLCNGYGLDARAVEVSQLAAWPKALVEQYKQIVFLFPDGDEKFNFQPWITVTNHADGFAAQQGGLMLPLLAGPEKISNSKISINGGVLLWFLCRQLTKRLDGSEEQQLKQLRQRTQLLVEGRAAFLEQWQNCLHGLDRFALIGVGQQSLAARQTEVFLSARAGQQSSAYSTLAALFESAEMIGPGWAVISFENSTGKQCESDPLFSRLLEKGARCIRVVDGFPQLFSDAPRPQSQLNPELAVFLNILSGQILSIHLGL